MLDIGHFVVISTVLNVVQKTLSMLLLLIDDAIHTRLGLTLLLTVICELLVGFLLGFGLIATWIPGEGAAETKMLELQKKLALINTPLGFVSIVTGILLLLYQLKILKPF